MSELAERILEELDPDTSLFKVLVYLSFRGPCRPADVSRETGIKPGTVRPALRDLLEKGFVEQVSEGVYRSLVPFTDMVALVFKKISGK